VSLGIVPSLWNRSRMRNVLAVGRRTRRNGLLLRSYPENVQHIGTAPNYLTLLSLAIDVKREDPHGHQAHG